jgi:ribonuclease R
MVGTLQRSRSFYYVVPDDPRFVHDIYVRPVGAIQDGRSSQTAATVGDKGCGSSRRLAIAPREIPRAKSSKCSGLPRHQAWTCFRLFGSIICRRNFRPMCWSRLSVIRESVDAQQITGREDLRNQFIATIDPDDARDFDDAINVEKLPNGGWQLGGAHR